MTPAPPARFLILSAAPRARGTGPGRRGPRAARFKLSYEAFEDRTLLTSYLYVDYGDSFNNGQLQTTTDALVSHTVAGGIDIQGPQLTDITGANYASGTTLRLNSFGSFYGTSSTSFFSASTAAARQTIDALVQRAYAPFDVTVIDLTPAGTTVNGKTVAAAASLDDVSRTLAASGDGHDSYVLVGQAILNGTVADNTHDPTQFVKNGYGGIASGLDFNNSQAGNNTHQGTALALLRSDYGENKVAQTIAHEAGHLFGMTHVWRVDQNANPDPRASVGAYRAQLDQYSSYETMSYLSFSGFSTFSRLPMVADTKFDGTNYPDNTDTTFLTASPTPYDHMIADPGVGASNEEYVTGSGANDIITITKASPTTATVTVQPFTDTNYTAANAINIPGQATATYTYTINTTKPIVVDGGNGLDRFVIDGDLGTTVTVRADSYSGDPAGGNKGDTLIVLGKGAASGSYTPGTNNAVSLANGSDLRGSIVIGSTTINFQEFSTNGSVTVSNVTSFTYTTPPAPAGGSGGNDLTIDSTAAGQNRVSGTTSGVSTVPLLFSEITNFTVDTATNNASLPNDSVTLSAPGLVATGLQNFTINTGAGDDLFTANANFALPVPGGQFTYNAGPQATAVGDNLVVNATGTSTGAFNPDGGTADNGTFNEDGTNLATTSLERAEVDGFTGFTLTTPGDADVMAVSPDTANTNSPAENKITGSSGGVGFSTLSFYDTTNFTVDAVSKSVGGLRGDSFTVNNPGGPALQASGLQNFTINSGPGNDALTINANDLRLPTPGGKFTFDAGSGVFPDGTNESNLRGLISLDRVVVTANEDMTLSDLPHTFVDNTPIPDDTPSGVNLALSAPGSGSGLGTLTTFGVEAAVLNGGPATAKIDASGFSGAAVLRSGGGTTTLTGGSGDNVIYGGAGTDTLNGGPARADGHAHDLIGGGGTNVLVGGPGTETFNAGSGGTTMIGGAGSNTFNITNPAGTVFVPIGGYDVIGGAGATNVLNLSGGGGAGFTESYMIGTFPANPLAVFTLSSLGLDVPTLLTSVQFNGEITTANSFATSGAVQPVNQSVRVAGPSHINDSVTAKALSALAATAAQPITDTGSNLAGGSLLLQGNATPFTSVTFSNKTTVGVYGAGGKVVAQFSAPAMMAARPLVAAPVKTAAKVVTPAKPVVVAAPVKTAARKAPAVSTPVKTTPSGPATVFPAAKVSVKTAPKPAPKVTVKTAPKAVHKVTVPLHK
jgi:hypothetical protein